MKRSISFVLALLLLFLFTFQEISFADKNIEKPEKVKRVLVKYKEGKDN